jgi:hypothetical protein
MLPMQIRFLQQKPLAKLAYMSANFPNKIKSIKIDVRFAKKIGI